jgi:hypothetical protein
MYKEVLRSIVGIEIFPVVSLVIFVTFFTLMLVWALRLRSEDLTERAHMPLDPATVPDSLHSNQSAGQGARRDAQTR